MNFSEISIDQIAIAIPIVIGVTQGIKKAFNVQSKTINLLLAIFLSAIYMVYLLFKNNETVEFVYYFIILVFGATGIYDFIPKQKENEVLMNDNYSDIDNYINEKEND